MNEAPPLNLSRQPKHSGFAIWSLVLGILGLICFSILSAIPAVICGHMALARIKRSAGVLTGKGLAIAGLVTGYLGIAWAVVFIPMMAAIAIPNFVKARSTAQRNACVNNLRQIEAATQQWALQNQKKAEDPVTVTDLQTYFPNGQTPTCPAGGVYTLKRVGELPSCSTPNHALVEP
jgi:hypothetical protein